MIFMFCKFPDIAAGNFGDVISTSTFTLYAGQYIHRLLNGDYLLIGIYFGGVFLIGVTLLYDLISYERARTTGPRARQLLNSGGSDNDTPL